MSVGFCFKAATLSRQIGDRRTPRGRRDDAGDDEISPSGQRGDLLNGPRDPSQKDLSSLRPGDIVVSGGQDGIERGGDGDLRW